MRTVRVKAVRFGGARDASARGIRCDSRRGSTRAKLGVVLVDHGSKKKASNEMLDAFAEMYRATSGRDLVEVAHMEIAEPSIPTALEKCVERGALDIVVAPYFLSPGRHIQKDIPKIVEDASSKYPHVNIEIADPIGLDPLVAEVIESRVKATICASEGKAQTK